MEPNGRYYLLWYKQFQILTDPNVLCNMHVAAACNMYILRTFVLILTEIGQIILQIWDRKNI